MNKLLVVDDDAPSRQLIAALAASLDCEVREAGSGAEGLKAVEHFQPDLIVLDLDLPDMHGAAFLSTLRHAMGNETTVALYTATVPDRAMRDFMRLFGVTFLVPKPGEAADVLRVLAEALR